ncbi:MAG TPA: DUF423 domain-containing protein [Bacteroidia bacterium]|nr:DUF423 domain-containing protein [Bacteroidia bacterium]
MSKKNLAAGFLFAALAVILGAFAAHGLKQYVDSGKMDLQMLQNFETAVRYQMYHAFALITCGILGKVYGENKFLKIAGLLFIIGIIFFSGSLYLLSTRDIIGLTSWKWLGPITPLGGLCFISAWILLAISVLKKQLATDN